MISPKIANGDLVIENNDFVMAEDDEELIQSVQMVVQTSKGEFFLEPDHGLTRDNVLGKEANQDDAHDDIVEVISQEERIASVDEIVFNDDRKSRVRSISLTLQKETGEAISIEEVELDVG